ncbi:universal stress protein [Pedobacter sp. ISL-68]|uniref:universal stress protein n=1 Tax=Pedobacter sp. ISL-68 TaxID=2819165 RepID=UPI001BEC470C|nr:universal stress protein [Pedobacter sp. ISL-68]MBT2591359.1 universal stress protein [Pedobacter sp. ISL-68]
MKTTEQTNIDLKAAATIDSKMKTIMVLTDFSAAASDAADYALGLAGQINASRIILCYSDYIPAAADIPLESAIQAAHEEQEHTRKLALLKEQFSAEVYQALVEIFVDKRSLATIVNDFDEEHAVDLVVMGMTGKSRLEQALIGSNTINVAKAIKVPLLIVPEGARFHKIERILLACDLKETTSALPIGAIKSFAGTIQPRLFVLNVEREDEHSTELNIEENSLRAHLGTENITYHRIRHHNIADGIALFAAENRLQLIIAVPKHHSFFESLFHQSLTKRLAYHTHIPLLLFKETH